MRIVIISALVILFSSRLSAQAPSGVCVFHKELPIVNAHVQFRCLDCSDQAKLLLTNKQGKVINPFIGETEVYISYLGFTSILDTIKGEGFKNYTLQFQEVNLNGVVITAQYAPNNPENAVHKIVIIDQKKIVALGAVNLRDVLVNEANIRISEDNVLGSSTSIQGVSGQNVKILIDGIPVIGRLSGNIDLSQINLNNIERIEIIEGPLSVEYGTNALAGTINLITKKSTKENFNIGINSFYETVGKYNLDAVINFKLKKNRFNISGGRNYFDGWNSTDPFVKFSNEVKADSTRFLSWKPKEQYFGGITYSRNIKKISLSISSDYFEEQIINKGKPRAPYFENAFDDYYNTVRWSNSLAINGKIAKSKNINILFAWNTYERIKNTYFIDLTTLQKKITENKSDQDTTGFNLFMARGTYSTSRDSSKLNFSVGYDINIETGQGKRIEEQQKTIGDYAGFVSAEYKPIQRFTIRPGLRYSYNTSYDAPLTPSLNIKLKTKIITLRGSYARGFRAPSIKDLYFDFVDINHDIQGNPYLVAETSHNFNLSGMKSFVKKGKIFKFSLSGFYNNIHNLITLAQGEGTSYSYFNLARFKTFGSQLNLDLSIHHFKFSIGGTYTGRYNSLSDSLNVKPYSYAPEIRSSALYEFRKQKIQLAAFYKYSGKIRGYFINDDEDIMQSLLGDFHTLDVTISKKFWRNNIKWTIGGKNLFNVTTITSQGATGSHSSNTGIVPMSWGRSIFTALKINVNSSLFKKNKHEIKH